MDRGVIVLRTSTTITSSGGIIGDGDRRKLLRHMECGIYHPQILFSQIHYSLPSQLNCDQNLLLFILIQN